MCRGVAPRPARTAERRVAPPQMVEEWLNVLNEENAKLRQELRELGLPTELVADDGDRANATTEGSAHACRTRNATSMRGPTCSPTPSRPRCVGS